MLVSKLQAFLSLDSMYRIEFEKKIVVFFSWNSRSMKCKHDPALKVCQSNDLENQIHKQSWQEDRQQKNTFRNHLE